jgi:hypothetical protein
VKTDQEGQISRRYVMQGVFCQRAQWVGRRAIAIGHGSHGGGTVGKGWVSTEGTNIRLLFEFRKFIDTCN